MLLREAEPQDGVACAEIYAPYVRDTAVTFELDAPGPAEMAERIVQALTRWSWFVAEDDGQVVGYAYGGEFRARAAYRWACEVSVYLHAERTGRGLGRALYDRLLPRLTERGYRTAMAGMTLPNDASVGLHTALGFRPVGVQRRIGWKHGRWHDVALMQRTLSDAADPPAEPR